MSEDVLELEVAEALWTLGLLKLDLLPNVAIKALESELDSPSLRQLAGLDISELGDADRLFEKTLRELGREKLTRTQAVLSYAVYVSNEIVSGREEPHCGARKIWKATLKLEDRNFHDLDPFIYACGESANRPEDREFFSSEIIKEAARVIEKNK